MAKTYGQFCGLARTLDHIGDRWTLLMVRELLIADASYGELLSALHGIPTNLLAGRLRQLEDDGLVSTRPDPADGRRVVYELTPLGKGLEPAMLALIRWGSHWMRSGMGRDRFDARWACLAVRALIANRTGPVDGTVALRLGDESLTVTSSAGVVTVERGAPRRSDASMGGPPEVVLGFLSGEMGITAAIRGGLQVRGDRALARRLLQP